MNGADRERFEAWLGRQMQGVGACATLPTCVGGPIDGREVGGALAQYRLRGGELIVPALHVLTGPHGERSALEHVYRVVGGRMRYEGLRAVGA